MNKNIKVAWRLVPTNKEIPPLSLSAINSIIKSISKCKYPLDILTERLLEYPSYVGVKESIMEKCAPETLTIEDECIEPMPLYENLKPEENIKYLFRFNNKRPETIAEEFIDRIKVVRSKGIKDFRVHVELYPDITELRVAKYVFKNSMLYTDYVMFSMYFKDDDRGLMGDFDKQMWRYIDKNFKLGAPSVRIKRHNLNTYQMWKRELYRTQDIKCKNNVYEISERGTVRKACNDEIDEVDLVKDNPFYFLTIKKDIVIKCPYKACNAVNYWDKFVKVGWKSA